jgi:hypothetical protein
VHVAAVLFGLFGLLLLLSSLNRNDIFKPFLALHKLRNQRIGNISLSTTRNLEQNSTNPKS